ncbi:MAG: hypothetical protein M3N95_03085 [Actinomycetota bacterium]|nr:hypothetical protein [Actinomycetota bacterium]
MHTVIHILGLDNPSGYWYLWWSGVGANLQELALFGVVITVYRRHKCHAHRCWRLAKHTVDGTPYVTCKTHHPLTAPGRVTAQDIADAHLAAQAGHAEPAGRH